MSKTLAFVMLGVVGMVSAGCRDDGPVGGPVDLSVKGGGDGGMTGGPDLAMMKTYQDATPNAIDTNGPGGTFGKGTAVKLSGMVAVTPVTFFKSSMGTKCNYEVWVQDPACVTGPCGIVVIIKDLPVNSMMQCPYPDKSGTDLAMVQQGDNLDITGVVDTFASTGMPDGGASSSVLQHEIEADSVTIVAKTKSITPLELNADTLGQEFVTYGGSGWAMYEGMYITLKRPSGKLTVTSVDSAVPYHFRTSPGGTDWGTTFRFNYNNSGDAGISLDPVPLSSTWTSISGVVTNLFGGALCPTQESDFVP